MQKVAGQCERDTTNAAMAYRRRRMKHVAVLSTVVLLLAACTQQATPSPSASTTSEPPATGSPGSEAPDPTTGATASPDADEPKYGGTFVMAVGIDIPELDPHTFQTFANLQMYEAFFRRSPTEYGQFLPAAAESMDVSEDGLEYTLNLRPGMVFHDGSPVTAEAVVFGLQRQADPEHPFHQGGPYWTDWARGNPGVVTDIEAVDDLTVRITLSEPVVDIEFVFADENGMGIINPAVIEADPENFGQNPIGAGSGPFKFEERVAGDYVSLVRNEDYWDEDKPYLDGWILRTMLDPGARLLALKNGDIHMFDVSGPEIAQLENDPDVQLITVPPLFGSFIAFDHNDPVTGDPLVRQAINHAIDMESIVSELSPFAAVTPNFGLFPGLPGHREDIPGYAYDPAEAEALLEQAGYSDGVDLTFSFSSPPVGLNHQILAQAIQAQLQEVGFRVTLEQVDGPAMFESGFGPPGREDYPFQMALNTTGSDGNSLGMLAGWTSRSNYASVYPEYLDLFFESVVEVDEDARLEIFGEMQQALYDDVAYIPLAHTEVVRAVASNVRGIETAAFNMGEVWLDD